MPSVVHLQDERRPIWRSRPNYVKVYADDGTNDAAGSAKVTVP